MTDERAGADRDEGGRQEPDTGGRDTAGGDGESPGTDGASVVRENGIEARYYETAGERILAFDRDGRTAAVAQNSGGYAMLKVRPRADGDELERYYGFDMALDHAAELLGVSVHHLPVPDPAADMGM